METNEHDEVVVDDVEETNEKVLENTEDKSIQVDKPKRTPQEEYEYYMGRAQRLAKKHGLEAKETPKETPRETPSSKPGELDLGGIAYLNSMVGLKGKDEIALAREYLANGKDVLELSENKFFKQDLQALREARESEQAIPKGKPRTGHAVITDVDLAVAKYKETGELPADFDTRNKVIDSIVKSDSSPLFSGPSVIDK